MTVLGKTLVFFNLVFSLITAALVLMVFSARTNWVTAAKKFEDELKTAQASAQAYQKEAQEARQGANERVDAVAKELENVKGQLAQAQSRHSQDDDKYNKEKAQAQQAQTIIESIKADRDKNAEEVKILVKQKDAMKKHIDDLVKTNSDMHDQKVNAEITANSFMVRNKSLVEQIRGLEKANQELRVKGGGGVIGAGDTATASSNPPRENVEGRVTKYDKDARLLTLSIGSDSGLAKGHTLEVFRLEPQAKYLGVVQIVAVYPHSAVAQPKGKPLGTIQEGDHVASKIQGGE